MGKLAITEKKLLKQYNHAIDVICEDFEEKSTFSGQEVCAIVNGILTKNKVKPTISDDKLYKLYSEKVKSLKLTRKEWVDNYGIPEIISMIYKILEENI